MPNDVPDIDSTLPFDKTPSDNTTDRRRVGLLLVTWFALVGAAVLVGSQLNGSTSVDHRISVWFADHRSAAWNKVTASFSNLASTFVVIGIALLIVVICAMRRRWPDVVFIAVAMAGEVTMFLTITLLVDRSRPDVLHLDGAPPTSSFPSGHVFAAFVLWNTIAVIALRQQWASPLRIVTRILAIAMPVAVGLSRISRGMHHTTDVLASFVLGIVWVSVVCAVLAPEGRRRRQRQVPVDSSDRVALSH